MGGLLQALFGKGAAPGAGGSSSQSSSSGGYDSAKALQFTQDKWNDLKNAYVVYHQAIWEALLFYANQTWIEWDEPRKVFQLQQSTDEWVPRPRINRFSPTIDAVASNFSALPPVEAIPRKQDNPDAHLVAQVCCDLADYAVQKEGLKSQAGRIRRQGGARRAALRFVRRLVLDYPRQERDGRTAAAAGYVASPRLPVRHLRQVRAAAHRRRRSSAILSRLRQCHPTRTNRNDAGPDRRHGPRHHAKRSRTGAGT